MAEVRRVVQADGMRLALALAAVGLLLVGAPALAASPDLGRLVLRASDVPARFAVVPDETGPRSNQQEWREAPEMRPLLQRAGRVTGHESRFERGIDSVSSRVDLFRTAAGPRIVLDYFDREMRKSGIRGLQRSRRAIGDEAWLYGDRQGHVFTVVVWRNGPVFSGIASAGVPRTRILTLARLQQRRIAAGFG